MENFIFTGKNWAVLLALDFTDWTAEDLYHFYRLRHLSSNTGIYMYTVTGNSVPQDHGQCKTGGWTQNWSLKKINLVVGNMAIINFKSSWENTDYIKCYISHCTHEHIFANWWGPLYGFHTKFLSIKQNWLNFLLIPLVLISKRLTLCVPLRFSKSKAYGIKHT